MRYDQKPVHRKLIIPWHDSQTACLLVIGLMLLVFLFALVGVSTAGENTAFRGKIWLPVVLMLLSAGVLASTTIRLIRRLRHRFVRDLDLH